MDNEQINTDQNLKGTSPINKKTLLIGAVVVLVLAAGIFGYLKYKDNSDNPEDSTLVESGASQQIDLLKNDLSEEELAESDVLAGLFYTEGKYKEALEIYLRIDKDDLPYNALNIADTYEKLGDQENSVKYLRVARDRFKASGEEVPEDTIQFYFTDRGVEF